jgi:hypothetical protein
VGRGHSESGEAARNSQKGCRVAPPCPTNMDLEARQEREWRSERQSSEKKGNAGNAGLANLVFCVVSMPCLASLG